MFRTPTPIVKNAAMPPLQVERWFNTATPLHLDDLRGRVVVLLAFQMLCPGCVSHAIPQVKRLHDIFSTRDVVVVGLHTVFEHHEAMGAPAALYAFLHEYRLSFPVGLDRADPARGVPHTMQALSLRGTPSLLVLDRAGRLRLHHFGHLDDLRLGALVGQLQNEPELGSLGA